MAANGLAAIEYARKSRPDIILLDLMMPGLPGFEVSRRLRGDPVTASTPIIVVTGMGRCANMEGALACGADDFLTKPVCATDLLARVGALLSVRDTREEIERLIGYLGALERERQNRRRALASQQSSSSRADHPQGPTNRGTVLVVSAAYSSYIHAWQLQGLGYRSLAASSVEEAWAVTAQQRPDVIVMDATTLQMAAEGVGRYLARSQSMVPVILTLPPSLLESWKLPVPAGFFGVLPDGMDPALAAGILQQAIRYGQMIRSYAVGPDRPMPKKAAS